MVVRSARERAGAADGLVEHHAQAIDIAANVGRQGSGEVFGGHVLAAADDRPHGQWLDPAEEVFAFGVLLVTIMSLLFISYRLGKRALRLAEETA